MLGGADNPNGELPSYITGANRREGAVRIIAYRDCFGTIVTDIQQVIVSIESFVALPHQWFIQLFKGF